MKYRMAAAAAALALSACGGGGDDGPTAPTADYNARAAWQRLLTQPNAWALSGTASDGRTYELRLGVAPVGNSAYPVTGVAANRADISTALRLAGVVQTSGIVELFYDDALQVLGSRATSSSTTAVLCDQATLVGVPPAATRVGTSGVLYNVTELAGCSSGVASTGTSEVRWSVEFESGLVWFCLDATGRDLQTPPTVTTEKDCFEIDTAGNLGTRARVALAVPGFSISARN